MMFHESRDALVANVTPHVVAADAYLAGAKETAAPWPNENNSPRERNSGIGRTGTDGGRGRGETGTGKTDEDYTRWYYPL